MTLRIMMTLALATAGFLGCDESSSGDAEAPASIPEDTPIVEPPVEEPPIEEPPIEEPPIEEPPIEEPPIEEPPIQGVCANDDPTTMRPAGWARASHCKGEDANYELLFPDDRVHRIDLTLTPIDYQAMLDNLDDLYGGGGGGPGGGTLDGGENPIYVAAQLAFDGLTWTDVGMRFKGNSSLQSAYRAGIRKMSFRLNFDKFEDDNPLIDNQRFHGFSEMTFSNGFSDASLIRDKLGADIFRDGGVPAARGAFARVFVDVGDGPVYFGLYTMIEDPSDALLDAQFGDNDGNLYKPEGDGATWSSQDPQVIARDFEKKTNDDDEDWSDVTAAIDALHADRANAAAWRAGLEARVDVQAFLRTLAINQVMVNWDSYGYMNHNYYVYADPTQDGRLVWFPWDLNESMLVKGNRGADPTDVLMSDVGDDWPMVRFMLDDAVYRADYLNYVQEALDGCFAEAAIIAKAQAYHDLIAPYVSGDAGEQAPYSNLRNQAEFDASLDDARSGLIPHIRSRHTAIDGVLAEQ